MRSLVTRVAIVGATAGALALTAAPAFAGGPPAPKPTWSASEHSKWTEPKGGVETGFGGAATSSSFPAVPAAAAVGGMVLLGGGTIARRRRTTLSVR